MIHAKHVYTMDVIEFLDALRKQKEKFDLAIIDPPYYKIVDHSYDHQWSSVEEYVGWMSTVLLAIKGVMNKNASVYLWGAIGYNRGYALPKLADWIESCASYNVEMFKVQNWITVKNTRGYGSKRGYMPCREELLFMTMGDQYTFNIPYLNEPTNRIDMGADGKPRKSQLKRVSDVWTDITESSQSSKQRFKNEETGETFAGTKSLDACRRIIRTSSNPRDKILVPFCGTGSECVVAEQEDRVWYTTDIDPWCVGVAKSRLEHEWEG